jgi:hypothetical protein
VNAVIQTLGVDISPRAIFERTILFSRSTRILVDAMKATGVKRLIAVTGLGAGDSPGHGGLLYDALVFPLLLKRVFHSAGSRGNRMSFHAMDVSLVPFVPKHGRFSTRSGGEVNSSLSLRS